MPLINFLNFYFLDKQNSVLITMIYFLKLNGGKHCLEGIFPSAETIGEFFAIAIFLYFIAQLKNGFKFSAKYLFLIFPVLGLYLSNNKAATFLLMVSLFLVLRNSYSFHKKYEYLFYLFSIIFLLYLVRFENLTFSFNFTSEKSWKWLQFTVLTMTDHLLMNTLPLLQVVII